MVELQIEVFGDGPGVAREGREVVHHAVPAGRVTLLVHVVDDVLRQRADSLGIDDVAREWNMTGHVAVYVRRVGIVDLPHQNRRARARIGSRNLLVGVVRIGDHHRPADK